MTSQPPLPPHVSAWPAPGPRPPGIRRRTKAVIAIAVLAVLLALAWVLVVWLPVCRIALSFVTMSGSTPLDLLLPADPPYRLTASLDGTHVTGSGETSLPDGSRVSMWAWYVGNDPGIHMSDTIEAVVADGRFSGTFDLAGWPAGPVMVKALFEIDETQPGEVAERYGADGARLTGPRVAYDDDTGTWALQDWQTVQYRPPGPAPVITPPPADAANPGSFAQVGKLTAGRSGHAAVRLADGRVLVLGGDKDFSTDPFTMRTTAELFDPAANRFTATLPTVVGRERMTASLLADGRVLVAGGFDGTGAPIPRAELFDPATGAFTPTGSMVTGRAAHTATVLPDGRVLVAGGEGAGASAELYDPATGSFARTGPMATGRSSHTATLLDDGRVLVAGGVGDIEPTATAELYDPATGTFTATGSMATPREVHAAVRLADGHVLVAGGLGPGEQGQIAAAELYDPATGSFASTADLVRARNYLSMTLLGDGRVLVAGGFDQGEVVAPSELYDPATGTFAPGPDLAEPGDAPTATLLLDGRVLVAGGYGERGNHARRAQVWQP